MNIQAQSWQDIQVAQPIDPRSIILNAALGSTLPTFTRAVNAINSPQVTSPLVFTGNNTKVASLDTTDAATIVNAGQWTMLHQMVNVGATIPPALNKLVFLRAGSIWDNQVEINFGASAYNNVYLGFRDNLGTSGVFINGSSGGVPVLSFGNGITGNQVLHVTIAQPGIYSMVLSMVLSGNYNAFEMEWVVLP
jgi:hypothetical protein